MTVSTNLKKLGIVALTILGISCIVVVTIILYPKISSMIENYKASDKGIQESVSETGKDTTDATQEEEETPAPPENIVTPPDTTSTKNTTGSNTPVTEKNSPETVTVEKCQASTIKTITDGLELTFSNIEYYTPLVAEHSNCLMDKYDCIDEFRLESCSNGLIRDPFVCDDLAEQHCVISYNYCEKDFSSYKAELEKNEIAFDKLVELARACGIYDGE